MQSSASDNPAVRRRLDDDSTSETKTSSVLRLTPEEPLYTGTTLQITHRVDTTEADYACDTCTPRNSVGDFMLPMGFPANSVLLHVHFAGGEVLQKYYKVAVHVSEATVPPEPGTTQPTTVSVRTAEEELSSDSYTQVLELDVKERKPEPFDDYIKINSLVNPNHKTEFSVTFFLTIVTIFGLITGFGICIILAIMQEYRPEGMLVVMFARSQ